MKRALFFLLFLTSCTPKTLSSRLEYVVPEKLASFVVDTPDLRRKYPAYGQRLTIGWSLKNRCYTYLTLHLTVRFGNREQIFFDTPLERNWGCTYYALLNQDYDCKCGIQTFKAQLLADGEVVETLTHPLWSEWIEITPDEDDDDFELPDDLPI